MTRIRTASALVLSALLAALGALLVAEATEVTSGSWRHDVADAFSDTVSPPWSTWVSALLGVALAVVGVTIIAAQFAPPKRGLNTMHEVSRGNDGMTRIRGRAAIAAARHELERIEGVVDAAPTLKKKRMQVEVRVDDRADIEAVTAEAQSLLGTPFWIDLGLVDFAVDILVVHHPKPPRVR